MHQIAHCRPHWLKIGLALAIVLTFGMGSASAQLTDPQLAIGPGSGQEPIQLGNTNFITVLNQGSGASENITGSWYVILGVANTTNTPLTSIAAQIISVNNSTLGTPISGIYKASMASGQDAYGQLHSADSTTFLKPYTNSDSFGNWLYGYQGTATNPTMGDLLLGINAQSYDLFAYQINTPLNAGGTDTIGFNSDLPLGSYVIAYGSNSQHTFSTPFTVAGFENGTTTLAPAPPGLALALSGCVASGLFSLVRRRKVIAHAAA